MRSFDKFFRLLLSEPYNKTLVVDGKRKKIQGMARFTSVNFGGDEYIKIAFSDNTHLVVVPSEKELFFAGKSLGKANGISDRMIGNNNITYKGKKYLLGNKNDYQFCLQVYVG